MRNLKKFFNTQFKIEECHDEVYDSDSSDEEENKADEEGEDEKSEEKFEESEDEGDKPKFAQSFIFSCIGIGLTNFARKAE